MQVLNADALVDDLSSKLREASIKLAVAESCTGGMLAASCTDLAGSSDWFERGYVTYSNKAKEELLGVPCSIIEKHGAVSEETALAMAQGALEYSEAQLVVSITGIAGPGGASEGKPVGTVWFAVASEKGMLRAELKQLSGDRRQVRTQAVVEALKMLLTAFE